MHYFCHTSVEWRTFDGISICKRMCLQFKTSLQCLYPTISERCLNVVLTSNSSVRILNVGLTLCERRLNVVITSYSNVLILKVGLTLCERRLNVA